MPNRSIAPPSKSMVMFILGGVCLGVLGGVCLGVLVAPHLPPVVTDWAPTVLKGIIVDFFKRLILGIFSCEQVSRILRFPGDREQKGFYRTPTVKKK